MRMKLEAELRPRLEAKWRKEFKVKSEAELKPGLEAEWRAEFEAKFEAELKPRLLLEWKADFKVAWKLDVGATQEALWILELQAKYQQRVDVMENVSLIGLILVYHS